MWAAGERSIAWYTAPVWPRCRVEGDNIVSGADGGPDGLGLGSGIGKDGFSGSFHLRFLFKSLIVEVVGLHARR